MLNQQAKLGSNGNDANFLASLDRAHGGTGAEGRIHPHYRSGRYGNSFIVCHFAGNVEYASSGMVRKNNDALAPDSLNFVAEVTSNSVVRNVCACAEQASSEGSGAGAGGGRGAAAAAGGRRALTLIWQPP